MHAVIILALLLAGCATKHEIITEDKDCVAEGGCLQVSRHAIKAAIDQSVQAGLMRGVHIGRQSCSRRDL